MKKSGLITKYSDILTTQDYGKNPRIEDVKLLPLSYYNDDSGEFVELGRLKNGKLEGVPGFSIAQASVSLLLPGAIKAFHIHFDQTDAWYVSPHDRLLVGLLDTRKDSPTKDQKARLVLGSGTANLLVIPPGVAHGAANPWGKPVTMFYFTDRQFNAGHPDEHRLPYDLFGKEFWELKKG